MTAEAVYSYATKTYRVHIKNSLGSTVAVVTPEEAAQLAQSVFDALKEVTKRKGI